MGFDCGLYVYPKYKNYTAKDYQKINAYFSYDTNDWAKKQFASADDYAKYICEIPDDSYVPVTENEISFFKQHFCEDEYGQKRIYRTVETWGSNGKLLYEVLQDYSGKLDLSTVFYDKDDIVNILVKVIRKKNALCKPAGYYVDACFRYITEESEEDPPIKVFACDGIELKDENGKIKRVETSKNFIYDEGPTLTILSGDVDTINDYNSYIDALIEIIDTVDFDGEIVEFVGGW